MNHFVNILMRCVDIAVRCRLSGCTFAKKHQPGTLSLGLPRGRKLTLPGQVAKSRKPSARPLSQAAGTAVLLGFVALSTFSGCRKFGSHRLECDLPNDLEYVQVTEPPLPEMRFVGHEIPPPPMDLTAESPDIRRRYLTITEAMLIALENNPDIRVIRNQQQEVARNITLADSVFDPQLQLGGGWRKTESQITNITTGPGLGVAGSVTDEFGPPQGMSDQFRLSKKTRTGGDVSAQFGTTYTFTQPDGSFLTQNPAVRSAASVQASHPLFRGSGREVNSVAVRMARANSHGAIHRTRITINKTLVDVATTYWALYGAIAELTSQETGVAEASETLDKEQQKLTLGSSSITQIAEATEQFERFRANRASARKAVADAERSLRTVMGISQEDGTRIVPVTIPESNEPSSDWETGYQYAMELRPELRIQESNIKAARLELTAASDLCRPNINGYAGYSVSGAGGTFDDSLQEIEGNNYTSWWMGFAYQQQLGRRVESATLCKAQYKLAREMASMQQVQQSVLADLHEAHQAVTNSWHIMSLQEDRRAAAAQVLEARRAMYDVGEISLELYLRGLAGFSISASEERAAVARYNQALIRWQYAQGRLMEFTGIQFEQFDPESPSATPNSEFINKYLMPAKSRDDSGYEMLEIPNLNDNPVPEIPSFDDMSSLESSRPWNQTLDSLTTSPFFIVDHAQAPPLQPSGDSSSDSDSDIGFKPSLPFTTVQSSGSSYPEWLSRSAVDESDRQGI